MRISKNIIVVGDVKQLPQIDDIGFMELTSEDVVRNGLVKKIVRAYENEKEQF